MARATQRHDGMPSVARTAKFATGHPGHFEFVWAEMCDSRRRPQ